MQKGFFSAGLLFFAAFAVGTGINGNLEKSLVVCLAWRGETGWSGVGDRRRKDIVVVGRTLEEGFLAHGLYSAQRTSSFKVLSTDGSALRLLHVGRQSSRTKERRLRW